MSTLPERVAKVEEKAEQQEKFNQAICQTVDRLTTHLQRIEIILAIVGAGIGLDRLVAIMGLLH